MPLPVATAPATVIDLPEYRSLALRSRSVDDLVRRDATHLGFGYTPGEFAACDGRGTTDWVSYSAESDPQVLSRRLAIPDDARRRLQRIVKTGATFDRLFILHELAPGTLRGLERTGSLTPAAVGRLLPTTTDPRVPRLAGDAAAAFKALGTAAAVGVGAAIAAPLALGAVLGAGALTVSGGLDPAVLGVVTASDQGRQGELCSVWMLAAWT